MIAEKQHALEEKNHFGVSPDKRIVEEVISGNIDAYEQLVERYWPRIYNRVYALLKSHEDAEEITQDTFCKALKNLEKFRWESHISTWLYQIGSNLARNKYWYWKRRKREQSVSLEAPISDNGFCLEDFLPSNERIPSEAARWNEFAQRIDEILPKLPHNHKTVLKLRLGEDMSYESIGELLDIPIGTVKSRIARAREHLLSALEVDAREIKSMALRKESNSLINHSA